MAVLCREPAALIVPHVAAITALLSHADGKTRHAALEVLAKDPPVLKACLRDVADRLDDHEAYARPPCQIGAGLGLGLGLG